MKLSGKISLELPPGISDEEKRRAVGEALGVDPSMIVFPAGRRRRSSEISFEIVGDASAIASLEQSLSAKGIATAVAASESAAADGEVWEEVDGVFLLRQCPAGRLLINVSIDQQRCQDCEANAYLMKGSTECVKCAAGAYCLPDACLQPGCPLDDVNFRPRAPGSSWQPQVRLDGSVALRVVACPAGTALIRDPSDSNIQGDNCNDCPSGTFSLVPSTWPGNQSEPACRACKTGMNCEKGGRDVSPKAGFWINPSGVLQDPASVLMHDEAISLRAGRRLGAAAAVAAVPEPRAFRCAQGACLSNWTCRQGHYGRLCGLCQESTSEGKIYAMGAEGCVECEEGDQAVAIVIAVAVGMVLLLAYYLAVWRPLIKSDAAEAACMSCIRAIQSTFTSAQQKAKQRLASKRSVTGYLKVVVGFCQVTASFLSNFEVDWPTFLAEIMSVFAIFNLDFFTLPKTECLLSKLTFLDKLMLCTGLPVGATVLLALPAMLVTFVPRKGGIPLEQGTESQWEEVQRKKKRSVVAAFFFSLLSFLFLLYPFVSKIVVGTFVCEDLDPELHFEGDNQWLRSDLREPCPQQGSFASIWAIFCVAVYPAGVPVLFLFTLYFFKVPRLARSKTTMHRLKAVLKEVGLYQDNLFSPQRWDWTTEPVNLLDESQCKSVLRHNFRGILESVESVEDSIQARFLGQLGMANAAGDAEQEEDEADLEQLPLNELRRLTAGKVRDLCRRRLIVVPVVVWDGETGEAEKSAIEYCGVLFNTYRAEYWWFEIFDMLRKLVLSAMLPFVLLPTARLNVGLVVSFFCLVVVFFTRPLIDASLDVLMIVSLITQTLTLLCMFLILMHCLVKNLLPCLSAPSVTPFHCPCFLGQMAVFLFK